MDGAAVEGRWWAGAPSAMSTEQASGFVRGSGHHQHHATLIHSGLTVRFSERLWRSLCVPGPVLGTVGDFSGDEDRALD